MVAITFPGQGSQRVGMGQELHAEFVQSRSVFEEVSEATGRDVSALCFSSDEDTLRQTQNAQLALFTCGVAAWKALHAERGLEPLAAAGHSVGEYAALVAAGVLELAEGARLVRTRGDLMARAPAGTMAAVLGLERETLEAICARTKDTVVVANDNCPGQIVISGSPEAVSAASEAAIESGAKRVLPLNVSGAFHSPLMASSAEKMGDALREVAFRPATIPVYANVLGDRAEADADWADLLQRQLSSNVRWCESVQAMRRDGVQIFYELGAGEVLTGLLKRIDRDATGTAVSTPAGVRS